MNADKKYSWSLRVTIYRPLGYERVYLLLGKVADTPFHIQGYPDDIAKWPSLRRH